jgi:hypothetical protein
MPTVAILRHVLIQFYYNDHDPPHFHARGRDFDARIAIADGSVLGMRGVVPASTRYNRMDRTPPHRAGGKLAFGEA